MEDIKNNSSVDVESIPSENLTLALNEENLHDQAFETKPVSYIRDCFNRFCKNKSSIVASVIILIIALYAIIVPFASSKGYRAQSYSEFSSGFKDARFQYVTPYCSWFKGTGFWDGTKTESVSEAVYTTYKNDDSNHEVAKLLSTSSERTGSSVTTTYNIRRDTYAIGNKIVYLSGDEYKKLLDDQESKGLLKYTSTDKSTYTVTSDSILKPLVGYTSYIDEYVEQLTNEGVSDSIVSEVKDKLTTYYQNNSNVWYKMVAYQKKDGSYNSNRYVPLTENGKVISLYQKDSNGNYVYSEINSGQQYELRVDYFDYFTYKYNMTPYMIFGANGQGQDIFSRLAIGTLFSLALGIGVSLVNFIIGLVWGAISGYYGGTTDLIMERITDIISNVPSLIILTICSIQFTNNLELKGAIGSAGITILAILIAFIYNGWVGVASTTRMQFYRFKGQEYVLASRTLGARDSRLIFKHILPNAVGTLVTSTVLMIPSVIFSESTLSYLGIIDLTSSGISSIGTLLSEGQSAGLEINPHVLLFPAVIISLLMICFNLFGNGLRDAFNTSLKGSED
jgi:oligopeptide transport system permease protein